MSLFMGSMVVFFVLNNNAMGHESGHFAVYSFSSVTNIFLIYLQFQKTTNGNAEK